MTINCPICGSDTVSKLLKNHVQCGRCGIAFSADVSETLVPSPPSEDKESVYHHSKKILFLEGLKKINELLPQQGVLLDIGCGHGYFMKLATDNGWRCEGIEISPPAITHCRRELNLNIYEKPLPALRLKENHYDVVTLWGVLDLVPNPKVELAEIYRVLKSGGMLFLRVNNFTFHSIAWKLGNIKPAQMLGLKPGVIHRWGINSKSLKVMLIKTGFEKIKIANSKPTSGDPYATGGKFGFFFVIAAKFIYYSLSRLVEILTFGKILTGSSLIAVAFKVNKISPNPEIPLCPPLQKGETKAFSPLQKGEVPLFQRGELWHFPLWQRVKGDL